MKDGNFQPSNEVFQAAHFTQISLWRKIARFIGRSEQWRWSSIRNLRALRRKIPVILFIATGEYRDPMWKIFQDENDAKGGIASRYLFTCGSKTCSNLAPTRPEAPLARLRRFVYEKPFEDKMNGIIIPGHKFWFRSTMIREIKH